MTKKSFKFLLLFFGILSSFGLSAAQIWKGEFESSRFTERRMFGLINESRVRGSVTLIMNSDPDPDPENTGLLILCFDGSYRNKENVETIINHPPLMELINESGNGFEFSHELLANKIIFKVTEHKKEEPYSNSFIAGTYTCEDPCDEGSFHLYPFCEIPQDLFVSGMPRMYNNWNGKYEFMSTQTGPEWHFNVDSNNEEIKIFRRLGHWCLNELHRYQADFIGPAQDSPIGCWPEFQVTAEMQVHDADRKFWTAIFGNIQS